MIWCGLWHSSAKPKLSWIPLYQSQTSASWSSFLHKYLRPWILFSSHHTWILLCYYNQRFCPTNTNGLKSSSAPSWPPQVSSSLSDSFTSDFYIFIHGISRNCFCHKLREDVDFNGWIECLLKKFSHVRDQIEMSLESKYTATLLHPFTCSLCSCQGKSKDSILFGLHDYINEFWKKVGFFYWYWKINYFWRWFHLFLRIKDAIFIICSKRIFFTYIISIKI